MRYLLFLFVFSIISGYSQSIAKDSIFDTTFKTILLYPNGGAKTDVLKPPIIEIEQNPQLLLEFDHLADNSDIFYAKIVNYNSDWSISDLSDMLYLSDYNQFQLTNYLVSYNTRTNYFHYTFTVPKVKISGNYCLIIYKDNEEQPLFTRRFSVFTSLADIHLKVSVSDVTSERNTHQQCNVQLNYASLKGLISPNDVKIIIRQNYRWDNAITNLKPLFIKDQEKILDYSYFSGENTFEAGNEFRVFDCRSVKFTQLNVDYHENGEVFLMADKNRNTSIYLNQADANGQFVIGHFESGGGETESDYVWVNFILSNPRVNDDIYIYGKLSDWKINEEFKMKLQKNGNYAAKLKLKQGYYNYIYVNKASKSTSYEGNFFQTHNVYDVLVYFKPFGSRNELLVGYKTSNQ